MARLVFRDSQGREGTVELNATEPVYVGRGLECAIRTDDGMVSRRHSQITLENGRYVIEDLGSANGTHLNNTRIQKQALGHADVVQCGSLMIRFLDEGGVNVVPQPRPSQQAAPPGKKGGTMVLERATPPPLMDSGGAQIPIIPNSAPAPMMPYGGPPQMPAAMPASAPSPYGGPPAMPGGGAPEMPAPVAALPYGGPPEMPGASAAMNGAAPLPYGGPPEMPSARPSRPGSSTSDPSMFGRGGPIKAGGNPRAASTAEAAEQKVMIELGLEHSPQKQDGEIKALRGELEKVNASYEREVADGKRVRAESATLRDRIDELRSQVKDREEQAAAHDRVADELRDELQQTRNELGKVRNELGEIGENMLARERQAGRAHEETAKIREDMEDLNRQLMELSRTKDEGWKKLNDQLTEIEHLREVINEQERMLEERRVGLISQEEVIKELRADKERTLKLLAQLRAERDEAATNASRQSAQVVALEEENKRLGRMVVEAQTDQGRTGGGDHMMRIQSDLKDSRVEHKKLEADRDRLAEQYEQADRDRDKLENRLATIEVELQEAVHGRMAAESARNVAQDALAKAEVARHRAAEESLKMAQAREQASTGGDDARRELDRLRRKVADLDGKLKAAAAGGGGEPADAAREREAAEKRIREATEKAATAERSLKLMQAELDAAKTDGLAARAEAARAKSAAASAADIIVQAPTTNGPPPTNGVDGAALASAAREVYDAINDILSEMRNNVVLVQGELPNLSGAHLSAVAEAVEALVDNAETAKGALRGLKDLAQG